jgi:hypothetical protein
LKKTFVSALAAALLCTSFAVAAEPQASTSTKRKRPAKPAVSVTAKLTVKVVDSVTKAALPNVQVSLPTGNSETTNAQGTVTFDKVASGSVTATLNRGGYESLTKAITVQGGPSSATIEMVAHPTATVTMVDNSTYQLDATAMEFGFTVPFVGGYTKSPKLDVCRDGTPTLYTKAEVKSINGPAVEATATSCCNFPKAQQISITLKSGETFNAILRDSCTGYQIDVVSSRKDTGAATYLPLKNVKKIEFP